MGLTAFEDLRNQQCLGARSLQLIEKRQTSSCPQLLLSLELSCCPPPSQEAEAASSSEQQLRLLSPAELSSSPAEL